MARRRVAPVLSLHAEECIAHVYNSATGGRAARELRALLAVARAASKIVVLDGSGGCFHPAGMKAQAIPLARALYRLAAASREGRGGGR